jgi:hypothetical protein
LIGDLEAAGHICVGDTDLSTDARVARYVVDLGTVAITNPRFWGRPKSLHPLIENLAGQMFMWLLLPGARVFNQGSAKIVRRSCRVIQAVGED